jgi:DNA modification methylase
MPISQTLMRQRVRALGSLPPDDLLNVLIDEFQNDIGFEFCLPNQLKTQCVNVLEKIDTQLIKEKIDRRRQLLCSIRKKLKLSLCRISDLYGAAAALGITFNYNQKRLITDAFNCGETDVVVAALVKCGLDDVLLQKLSLFCNPVRELETLAVFREECESTINPRTKVVDETMTARMLEAVFSGFLFNCFPVEKMYEAIDSRQVDHTKDFWASLHDGNQHLFARDNALWVIRISEAYAAASGTLSSLRSKILSAVAAAYNQIDNHGVLAILIDPLTLHDQDIAWELAADVTLFAERFREERLGKGYFQRERIEAATKAYVAELSENEADFGLVFDGFTYLDTFVLQDSDTNVRPGLLLTFQKNCRDETTIPCPACRSTNVRGNSYSSMGVRAWECQNFVCPDRSKSNRGKRYSFLSLLKQRAIEDEANTIPSKSIKQWRRDVVAASVDATLEMLVCHFSIAGDTVCLFGMEASPKIAGRNIRMLGEPACDESLYYRFCKSAFFQRFLLEKQSKPEQANTVRRLGDDRFSVLQGDAFCALDIVAPCSIDGAVTSPPYYNARDYAQWENLYCYMYDMYNIALKTFLAMKPGALYLYNIFDYFDNDRTITLSAMGQKRIPLSAFAVHAFRAAGFTLMGNVVWDKGEIEGKRGFNGGNASPYYQAPFNCWEHILVFAKPGGQEVRNFSKLPKILREKPVIKMVKGVNVHGHTAPFPDALPVLLTDIITAGGRILDPFGGSLTSARVAEQRGLQSISIERDAGFVDLGLEMRKFCDLQVSLVLA